MQKIAAIDAGSNAMRMIVGNVIKASVSPPARIDQPKPSVRTNSTKPNSPKMIDGTPAKHSVPKRMVRVSRLSRVYSHK